MPVPALGSGRSLQQVTRRAHGMQPVTRWFAINPKPEARRREMRVSPRGR